MGIKIKNKNPGARSPEDREKAFKAMFGTFKRRVNEAGIIATWKQHQFFESNSEKRKRKMKETRKRKLKDYFG